ncbi:MAG: O-antigen ligase family protein, partial [Nevskiales bacterium]
DALEKIAALSLLLWGLWLGLARGGFRDTTAAERGLFVCFGLMLTAALLSYLVNGRPETALKMLPKYARLLLFIPLYVLFRDVLQTRHFWLALGAVAVVLGGWNLLEGAGGVEGCRKEQCFPGQINGTIGRTPYGLISLALAGVLAAGAGYYRRRYPQLLVPLLIAAMLVLYGALGSGNRTALLALPGVLIIWLGLSWRNGQLRARSLAVLIIALISAIALAWPVIQARVDNAQQEIAAYNQADAENSPSFGSRLHWWRGALNIFLDHPVVGVGPRQYRSALAERVTAGLEPPQALPHHPHNEYLSAAAGQGVIGLLALLLLWGGPLTQYWRGCASTASERQELGMAGILMLGAFAQGATTAAIFDLSAFSNFYILLSAALCGLVNSRVKS